MKKITLFILLFLTCGHLHSQQLEKYCVFKNDSSYLKLYQDSIAEFKIYKKTYPDTMLYQAYKRTHQDTAMYFNMLQRYCQMEGKGTFYLKDSAIYINTALSDEEYYPKFENVGNSNFNGKLSLEVFSQDNKKIKEFDIIIRGKGYYDKKTYYDGVCEIDLLNVKKNGSIQVVVENNSIHKSYVGITIPLKSINTDKIKVYLTDIVWIRNKLLKFKIERKNNSFCVIGPIEEHSKRRFNLKYGFHQIVRFNFFGITLCSE